ncbi:MAG: hypothetical protein Unbinned1322contig1000_52 [Prokaryotic dsDNA virus sp.]|nr:hypothetical protein [Aequorivita sp.]QDP57308.1 MAG: hypothetical protein Unbinned1322contig1000_52 [Prokaryotic dsDNA virus sp.]|tara:strand:- start:37875 stop:39605 length:1731 start_codon:yes stop_codon:yes gene_type:complete
MAERDDIRLRDQVAPQAGAKVFDTSKAPEQVNVGGLLDQASKGINAHQKAKIEAESTYLTDIVNSARQEYFNSQAKIAQSKKLGSYEEIDNQAARLKKIEDKFIADAQPHLRAELRTKMNTAKLGLIKFQTMHASKEEAAYKDEVNTRDLKLSNTDVLYSIGDTDKVFSGKLDGVREVAERMARADGFAKPDDIRLYGSNAEGAAIVNSLKSTAAAGESKQTKELFEKYEDRIIDPKQRIEAQKLVKAAEEQGKITEAINLKNEARRLFGDNPAAQRRYIEAKAKVEDVTGEVAKEALSMQKTDQIAADREVKREKERTGMEATNKVLEGKPGALRAAKLMAPHDAVALTKLDKQVKEGTLTVTQPEAYNSLIDLYRNDEEFFKQVELGGAKYATTISKTDLKNLKSMQDNLHKEVRDRKEELKYSTVKSVGGTIDALAGARGMSKEDDPGGYQTMWAIATDIYGELLEDKALVEAGDKRAFDAEFARRLRVRAPLQEDQSFFRGLFGRELEAVSQIDIIERGQAGEDLVDQTRVPDEVRERIINRFKERNDGKAPSLLKMQELVNAYAKRRAGLK